MNAEPQTLPDPRPQIRRTQSGSVIDGVRCTDPHCRYPVAFPRPRCPSCGSPVEAAGFGPEGTVWSATVVRVPVPGREPPYALAYVDFDDGPRVLCHIGGISEVVPVGTRVTLTDRPGGDPTVVMS